MRSAAKLFLRSGYDTVSVEQICAASGISGPGLYRHFSSKQHLLLAIIEDSINSLLAEATEIVGRHGAGETGLRRLVDLHADRIVHGTGALIIFQRNGDKLPANERTALRRNMVAYVELWTDCLTNAVGGDPEESRVKVYGLLGMMNSYPTYKHRVSASRTKEILTDLGIRAVGLEVAPELAEA